MELGTDAGTGAPNVAEPEVDGAGAPVKKTSVEAKPPPVETKAAVAEPKKEAKPRTFDEEAEELFKKHNGTTYKAGGKDKKAATWAEAKRVLASRDATDSVVSEALRVRQAADAQKAQIAALEKMPRLERIKALEAMGIKKSVIMDAFEEDVLSSAQREKELAGLSPRERELQQALEERDSKLAKYEQAQAETERQREEDAHVAESDALFKEMMGAAGAALQKIGIKDFSLDTSQELVEILLPALAPRMDRAKQLGLQIDPGELAEEAARVRGKIVDEWNAARPLEDLAASLDGILIEDPDKPGAKVSRLKLLMRHEAAKIRARQNGGQPASTTVRISTPQRDKPQSMAELMDAARTFGGGGV